MANTICFYDDTTIQTLADNDSPNFIGTPSTSKNITFKPAPPATTY